jgi:hypothetical protein
MWNQMIPLADDVDAIVLDCQGLNLNNQSEENMSEKSVPNSYMEEKLFTLALLLSSQMVFNTKGPITD